MVPIDHFDTAATRAAGDVAIVDGVVSLTFAELMAMSRTIAAAIARHDRNGSPVPVLLYGDNSYQFLAAMLGVMRAGGVIVPLHAPNTAETSLRFLADTKPRCAFFDRSRAHEMRAMQQAIPSLQECICFEGAVDGYRSMEEVVSSGADYEPTWIDASGNAERPVYYWATSGTTGEPKVVIETSRCFDVMLKTARGMRAGRRNVSLTLAPMTHGGGPGSFATLTLGGTVVIHRVFDPDAVLRTIERDAVTEVWLSPTALYLLLDAAERRQYNLGSLTSVMLGMAGVSPDKLKRAVQLFGPCITHSYGQIETSFVTALSSSVLADATRGVHSERLQSSGTSVYMNRVGIMDDDGRLLPPGEHGEIVVRGSGVKHYMDPQQTAAAQKQGWHRTGDVGYLDADGYLYVVGRIKDVVNMAGFKIAASEVERVVMELEAVQECAVVAVPDAVRGETIKAIVVVRPGRTIAISAVIQHCRSRLGNMKAPHDVETWTELPRSPVGKIDKRQIRARLLSPTPAGVACRKHSPVARSNPPQCRSAKSRSARST